MRTLNSVKATRPSKPSSTFMMWTFCVNTPFFSGGPSIWYNLDVPNSYARMYFYLSGQYKLLSKRMLGLESTSDGVGEDGNICHLPLSDEYLEALA